MDGAYHGARCIRQLERSDCGERPRPAEYSRSYIHCLEDSRSYIEALDVVEDERMEGEGQDAHMAHYDEGAGGAARRQGVGVDSVEEAAAEADVVGMEGRYWVADSLFRRPVDDRRVSLESLVSELEMVDGGRGSLRDRLVRPRGPR